MRNKYFTIFCSTDVCLYLTDIIAQSTGSQNIFGQCPLWTSPTYPVLVPHPTFWQAWAYIELSENKNMTFNPNPRGRRAAPLNLGGVSVLCGGTELSLAPL